MSQPSPSSSQSSLSPTPEVSGRSDGPAGRAASVVHEPARAVRVLRRTIAIVIVVAFSLAAVGGIIVLLGDIESDATFNVIWTTALTGAISVAAFCGATLIGRRAQWFGITTIALAVVTMALSLWFIWGDPYMNPDSLELEEILFQVLSSVALLTAVASVSSLILLLVPRSWVVRIGLPITLGLLALGTCLVLVTIWVESTWELEWLNRLNGIVWILAALGVVVVPLTSLLLKAGTKPAVASAAPSAPERAGSTLPPSTLSPSTLARLEAAAQAEGITADELVDRLLAVDPTPPDASATVSQSEPPRH